jgi:cytochrome b561
MIPAENTKDSYGVIAVALHWLMAVLLVVLLAMGLYMVRLPDIGFDKLKINLIVYHKELGILALLLMLFRWMWRLVNHLPRLVDGPVWQMIAARFVHLCFYALMVALPVTGWLMSSAAGFPVPFFGLFYLPDFIRENDALFQFFIAVHKWLAYALIAYIAVHMGAALWHHFVRRDATLKKMMPAVRGS